MCCRVLLQSVVAECCRVLETVAVCPQCLSHPASFRVLHIDASQHFCCRVLQCVAECCRVLQTVTECCRVMQSVAVCCSVSTVSHPVSFRVLHMDAIQHFCCRVLQSGAECCRVLQRGAECCSMLQYVHIILTHPLSFCVLHIDTALNQCWSTFLLQSGAEYYECCSVLQRGAAWCSVLRCVATLSATCCKTHHNTHHNTNCNTQRNTHHNTHRNTPQHTPQHTAQHAPQRQKVCCKVWPVL